MLGYMSVASMVTSMNFVMFVPILMHGWLTCGQIAAQGAPAPYSAILIGPIKTLLEAANARRSEYLNMKCDIEVYLGVYLIVVWFFGMSQILSIVLYWQVLRVRYMINASVKEAFTRFDNVINQ